MKPQIKRDNLGRIIIPPKRPGYKLISHDVVYYKDGRVKSRVTVWEKLDKTPS